MKVTQFLIGIAAGAVVGASTVLLSTPKSGSEVRSTLKSTSTDFKEKLSDARLKLQDVKISIENLTKDSKEVFPETAESLKESIMQWKSETAPIQQQLQEEISSIQLAMEELEKILPKPKEINK